MKLSIIVPAYNEEKRIENFAKELIKFSKNNLRDYEIIFVDDGSQDKTLDILKKLSKHDKNNFIKIIQYKKNCGKGAAVKRGVFNANGDKIIFIDADGAISPKEIPKMLKKLEEFDIVIGNRSSKKSKIKQPPLRILTGTVFSIIANALFFLNIRDTVCGFKGFRKKAAQKLFNELKSTGWIFDVEILYKAKKEKYSIYQLPFVWEHKEGTQMKIYTPILMIWELVKTRGKLF